MSTWLENLKVGDAVLTGQRYGADAEATTVARFTAMQVVTANGERYSRASGRRVGDALWGGTYLLEPTPTALDRIRRNRIAADLSCVDFRIYSLSTLEAVAALLDTQNAKEG